MTKWTGHMSESRSHRLCVFGVSSSPSSSKFEQLLTLLLHVLSSDTRLALLVLWVSLNDCFP